MKVLCKVALGFMNPDEMIPMESVNKLHRLHPSMDVQEAPDWIQGDPQFTRAVSDGSLIVVADTTIQSTGADVGKAKKAKAETEA